MAARVVAELMREPEDETHSVFRRDRVFRDRKNPFDCLDDIDFYERYRFDRKSVSESKISQKIESVFKISKSSSGAGNR
jgi:hypothetical protein